VSEIGLGRGIGKRKRKKIGTGREEKREKNLKSDTAGLFWL